MRLYLFPILLSSILISAILPRESFLNHTLGIKYTISIGIDSVEQFKYIDNLNVVFSNNNISYQELDCNIKLNSVILDTVTNENNDVWTFQQITVDSIFDFYKYLRSPLSKIAIMKNTITKQYYTYRQYIKRENEEESGSRLIQLIESNNEISVYDASGNLDYKLDLSNVGYNDDYEPNFGFYHRKSPIGYPIYLDDEGYLILKPNYAIGVYPCIYRFFNSKGVFLFEKNMIEQFSKDDFSHIGDTCGLINFIGEDLLLFLFVNNDSMKTFIGKDIERGRPYVKVQLTDENIVLFHSEGNFNNSSSASICKYSYNDLSLMNEFMVPNQLNSAKVLYLSDKDLIAGVLIDSTVILYYYNYIDNQIDKIGSIEHQIINICHFDNKIIMVAKESENNYTVFQIDLTDNNIEQIGNISSPIYEKGVYENTIERYYFR